MNLDFKLVRNKRKTTSLSILADGSLLVRAPLRTSRVLIEQFVNSKRDWIEKQRIRFAARSEKDNSLDFRKTNKLLFLGKSYPLEFEPSYLKSLEFSGERFTLQYPGNEDAARIIENWYRRQARKYLTERVSWYARKINLYPKKLRISSARTRWGSCSSKATLSFTWRLMQAPTEVIDYVVVHELMHMIENNHQKPFWNKVAEILPDYQQPRLWLKKNGSSLMNFARWTFRYQASQSHSLDKNPR